MLAAMSKKPTQDWPQEPREPLHEWRITRIKGSPVAYVGHARGADEKEAIRRAIHEFQITNPEHQKRLLAQRVN
jgi:hypothetical protein